jgi:hypothetical protein
VTHTTELIFGGDDSFVYTPAIRFGSGLGNWDALTLYVSTYTEVVEVEVGVPGKQRWPANWP